jgi:hypothetical protein
MTLPHTPAWQGLSIVVESSLHAAEYLMMDHIGKFIILLGILIVVIGVLVLLIDRIPLLGKLPGDIHIQRGRFQVYFPVVTSIVLSVVLTLIFWLASWLGRR